MYTIQRWFRSSYSIPITSDYGILKRQISTANISSPSSNQFRLHMWNRIHCHIHYHIDCHILHCYIQCHIHCQNMNCICCLNLHICMRHHMRDLNTLLIRMMQIPVKHMTMDIRDHNSHHGNRSCGNHDLKSNCNSVNF